MYAGTIVEYESTQGEEQEILVALEQNCAERDTIIFKEIHSFTQKSLDDKGAFLLDFCSEAFIWVGTKLTNRDR